MVSNHLCCEISSCILFSLSAFSQYHRISEWLKLEGSTGDHLVPPPYSSCRICYSGLYPGGSGIAPVKEAPQPVWATCVCSQLVTGLQVDPVPLIMSPWFLPLSHFSSTSPSACPARTSWACLWRYHGRKCQKPLSPSLRLVLLKGHQYGLHKDLVWLPVLYFVVTSSWMRYYAQRSLGLSSQSWKKDLSDKCSHNQYLQDSDAVAYLTFRYVVHLLLTAFSIYVLWVFLHLH